MTGLAIGTLIASPVIAHFAGQWAMRGAPGVPVPDTPAPVPPPQVEAPRPPPIASPPMDMTAPTVTLGQPLAGFGEPTLDPRPLTEQRANPDDQPLDITVQPMPPSPANPDGLPAGDGSAPETQPPA